MPLTRMVKLDDGHDGEVWLDLEQVSVISTAKGDKFMDVYQRGDGENSFEVADTPINRAKLGMVE